jgi:hypothetical protein
MLCATRNSFSKMAVAPRNKLNYCLKRRDVIATGRPQERCAVLSWDTTRGTTEFPTVYKLASLSIVMEPPVGGAGSLEPPNYLFRVGE